MTYADLHTFQQRKPRPRQESKSQLFAERYEILASRIYEERQDEALADAYLRMRETAQNLVCTLTGLQDKPFGPMRTQEAQRAHGLLHEALQDLDFVHPNITPDEERLLRVVLNAIAINFAKEENIPELKYGIFDGDSPGMGSIEVA